jgi:hypothetical protein
MASRSYICGFLLAGVLVALSGFGELAPLVLAAPAKLKKDAKAPVAQPLTPDGQAPAKLPKVGAKQPARTESSHDYILDANIVFTLLPIMAFA